MSSGSFDGIANKFDKNIYGTTKGRLRHDLLLHYLSAILSSEQKLNVLDVGGGTGVMSEEFAKRGHCVDIIDISEEALDIAKQRLAPFSQVRFLSGDVAAQGQVMAEQYDVIICHALLEWLSEPLELLSRLPLYLKPNGMLSLSFFNQDAMLFNNAIYGNFEYIEKGMKVRNVVRLNPHNPQQPKHILAHLTETAGLEVHLTAGLRCFHDYMRTPAMQNTHYQDLLALEIKYGVAEPYKWLGKYFYIQLKRVN